MEYRRRRVRDIGFTVWIEELRPREGKGLSRGHRAAWRLYKG